MEEKCDIRYMKDFLRKCNGELILERFRVANPIEDAKWIYAVLHCSKCGVVHNLLKKDELSLKELRELSSSSDSTAVKE